MTPTAVAFPSADILTAPLRREVVDSRQIFFRLGEAWRRLHARAPFFNPFTSWEWMYSWWLAYGGDEKQLYITVWWDAASVPVAICPLYLQQESVVPGFNVRVARWIGDGSSDSDYLDLVVDADHYHWFVEKELPAWLRSCNVADVMLLNTIPPESPLQNILAGGPPDWGGLSRVETAACGRTHLDTTLEAFLGRCRPRFRTKIRSLLRHFDSEDGLHLITDDRDLHRRLHSLYELHAKRWQLRGQKGVFNWRRKRLFYAHFVPKFARRGWLRFYSLARENIGYVAHQLCFGNDDRVYLLQEGFEPEPYDASYGQMLRALVFRHLIEQGVKVYDFLGGISRHKTDWQAEPDSMANWTIAGRRAAAKAYFYKPMIVEKSKANLKRWMPEPMQRLLRSVRGR